MQTALAVVAGLLVAAAIYMLLRRSIAKLVIGVALLSGGVNLVIFTAGGLVRGAPPLIEEGDQVLTPPFADPVPQALILTAIVISFGVLAFTVVLVRRAAQALGVSDVDELAEDQE